MPRRKLTPGEGYAGRRPDAAILNVTVDAEAKTILLRHCGPRGLGRLIARLAFELQAREEERQRIAEETQEETALRV